MLTLYRGDDYAGQLGKTLTIHLSLDAGLPIEGLKAVLEFYDIKKEFTPIQYENDFTIEVSHNQSKKYPLGVSYAKLYCVDSAGKIRTFSNRIPICVTTDLRKVYGSDGLDKQDVHVYALVHWDNIAGKPDYFPTTIEEVEGLEEALRQAGKVKTVNNIEPDENGNIHIELPSCKVLSVNGKEGVVVLNAGDIGYGDDSTIDSALAEAEENIKTNADNIDSLGQQVAEHIDNTYMKSEVDDKINQNAAHYLTADAEGSAFSTVDALTGATKYYYAGNEHTPDKNDYAIVLNDGGKTARWAYFGEVGEGEWQRQYYINETAFSDEQWAAINSLTSVDEDGNLCFNGTPIVNSSGELLVTEEDPIFTAWKNEVQIVLGSNASVASGKYKQIAIGAHAQANGQNAIALGSSEPGGKTNGPRAMAQNAIAIGAGAQATATNAVQIFAGTNSKSGTIQLGNKVVAFVSDIPITTADIDDYRYYKGHWSMGTTYKTGDIVRAERTVEGQEEKEVVYFKSLRDNNIAQNPFNEDSTYWTRTTDDEGLDKLSLFVKAAISTMTGADIPVSPTNDDKIDVALGKKLDKTILTVNGQQVFKNGTEEITTYSALLTLVKTGGVVLLDTVAGAIAKEALFYPHMVDETAIRFDATGTLGEDVYTRSFAFKPKTDGTDGIIIVRDGLIPLAKKSDVPEVVAPASYMAFSGKAADAYETGIRKADGVVLYTCVVSPEMSNILGVIGNPTDKNFVRYVNGVKRPIVITEDDKHINIALVDKSEGTVYEDWFYDKTDKEIHCESYSELLIGVYAKTALEALGLTDSAKALLFTDTAFKTKVEEIIDEHGGGSGDMTFVLKYNPEDEGYIYFDDGQPETTNA